MTPQEREAYKRGYDDIVWKPIQHDGRAHIEPARSALPCPMIGGDNLDKGCWGPDGKYHTSKSSLRASYKPSGNPMGNSYIEVGNEKLPEPKVRPSSNADIDKSIHKAIAQLGSA